MRTFTDPNDAASYIAGFVDGEGHISGGRPGDNAAGKPSRRICVANTEKDLIDTYCSALDTLEIKHHVYYDDRRAKKGWSPCWTVVVSGQSNLRRFSSLIRFGSDRKTELLERGLSFYTRSEPKHYVLKENRPVEQIQKWRNEGKTHREIGILLDVSRRTVTKWCNEAGVS